MNILYVHTHDTGRSIQPYDPGIPTPNLMKLAKEGTLFRNAYCCGPDMLSEPCGFADRAAAAYERHVRTCPQRVFTQ